MISIITDTRGTRTYSIPPQLLDVAKRLFPGMGEAEAVFALARRLSADRLATVERIAQYDIGQAAQRATEWMKGRRGANLGQLGQELAIIHS